MNHIRKTHLFLWFSFLTCLTLVIFKPYPSWDLLWNHYVWYSLCLMIFAIFSLYLLRWMNNISLKISIENYQVFIACIFLFSLLFLGKLVFYALVAVILCYLLVPTYFKYIHNFFLVEKHFTILIFAGCLSLLSYFSIYYTQHFPVVTDELAYTFAAKLYASGRMLMQNNFEGGFFIGHMLVITPETVISKYSPGHPLTLAIGYILGIPWGFPLVIAALTSVIVFFIAKNIYDKPTAYLTSLLFISSPFFIFTSQTITSQVSNLFYLSLFTLFYIKTCGEKKYFNPLIAGASLGMALITRNVTALAYVFPFILFALLTIFVKINRFRHNLIISLDKEKFIRFMLLIVVFSFFILFQLSYNQLMTNDPLLFPFQKYHPDDNIKFQLSNTCQTSSFYVCLENTFFERYYNHTKDNLFVLYQTITGWPLLSLIFFFIFLFSVKKNLWDYILLMSAFSIIFIYSFYWYRGANLIGPLYWYEVLLPLLLLISRGVQESILIIKNIFKTRPIMHDIYILFLLILFLFSYQGLFRPGLNCKPNVSELDLCNNLDLLYKIGKYRNTLPNFIEEKNIHNAVVFIENFAVNKPTYFAYTSPNPNEDVLYFLYLGPQRSEKFMKNFPTRDCYIYGYDTQSKIRSC